MPEPIVFRPLRPSVCAVFMLALGLVCMSARADELSEAVAACDSARVETLIESQPQGVNARLADGSTLLHLAAAGNCADLVSRLLSRGADPGLRDAAGRTPLQAALAAGAVEGVAVLVEGTLTAYAETAWIVAAPEPGTGVQAGDLEQAGEILTSLLRNNPGSVRISFALGLVHLRQGETGRAQLDLERVLMLEPGNDRARFELARAHLAAGERTLAAQEFRTVLARTPPPAVEARIRSYLKDIRSAETRWQTAGRVDAGAMRDDNANIGPRSDTIGINPITVGGVSFDALQVDESTQPVDALGLFVSAGLWAAYDLGQPAGWSLVLDGAFYRNKLHDAREYESRFFEAAAGVRHDSPRDSLQISLKAADIESGHDPLVTLCGLRPVYVRLGRRNPNLRWTTSAPIEYRDYDQLDDRDGIFAVLGQAVEYAFPRTGHSLSAGVSLFHDFAEAKEYEHTGVTVQAGGGLRATRRLRLQANLLYTATTYAAREPLAPEDRTDGILQIAGDADFGLTKHWGLNLRHQFTASHSTFDLYQYNRHVTTIGARCMF